MGSSDKSASDSSWQEDAARFLLRSGFRPGDAIGQIQHIANQNREERTFGSIWRAMRDFMESESHTPEAGP